MWSAYLVITALAVGEAAQPPLASEWGREVEVEFIVDGSGSMAGAVSGTPKIVWAKNALKAILGGLPETLSGADLGLRVYGDRSPKAKHDCLDTHLEVPLEGVRSSRLTAALGAIQPTGYTPLAASIAAAAKDFHQPGDRVVVIITDGIESCGGDPCAESRRAVANGSFLKPYVIGFAVTEEEKEKLSCIGTYLDARSGPDLQKLLDDVIRKAVVAARLEVKGLFNGKTLNSTQLTATVHRAGKDHPFPVGKAERVPPGDYEVELRQSLDTRCGPVVLPVKIDEGAVTRVVGLFGRSTVRFSGGGRSRAELAGTGLQIWPAGRMDQAPPMLSGKATQEATLCAGRYDFRFTRRHHSPSDLSAFEIKATPVTTIPIP